MTTVFVLVVLWLIVVVPMIVRRNDERRRDRSVDGFGAAMRALGRRSSTRATNAEIFVPRERRAGAPADAPVLTARRPVPAPEEALMYPVDRSDMSAARAQMMSRRRRSLGTLIAGATLFTLLAAVLGGMLWLLDAPFLIGTTGYLYFLRTQALHDRERRANRLQRARDRRTTGYEVTEDVGRFDEIPESVVRIDDDDIELQSMDTIDLTGLYSEDLEAEPVAQRRAS